MLAGGGRLSVVRALQVLLLAVAIGAAPVAASEVAAPPASAPGSAEPWIDRALEALRLGDTLAARIHARTVDHTESAREVVIELLRDGDARRRLGAAGREAVVASYGAARAAERYEAVYREVLYGARSGGGA